ncbi:hypothetical protein L6452_13153 [Arctium lappa]|uniref:Uncharacterized protein n=1 Tax=Arctium lappa TaxID=4217 RepID=A0ACB9CHF5_ARCLA|nr:hypothetical protein L6452_13153 [Arctium lappa]
MEKFKRKQFEERRRKDKGPITPGTNQVKDQGKRQRSYADVAKGVTGLEKVSPNMFYAGRQHSAFVKKFRVEVESKNNQDIVQYLETHHIAKISESEVIKVDGKKVIVRISEREDISPLWDTVDRNSTSGSFVREVEEDEDHLDEPYEEDEDPIFVPDSVADEDDKEKESVFSQTNLERVQPSPGMESSENSSSPENTKQNTPGRDNLQEEDETWSNDYVGIIEALEVEVKEGGGKDIQKSRSDNSGPVEACGSSSESGPHGGPHPKLNGQKEKILHALRKKGLQFMRISSMSPKLKVEKGGRKRKDKVEEDSKSKNEHEILSADDSDIQRCSNRLLRNSGTVRKANLYQIDDRESEIQKTIEVGVVWVLTWKMC